jgi:hypothetical protein
MSTNFGVHTNKTNTDTNNGEISENITSPHYVRQGFRHKSGHLIKQHEEYAQRQKPRANKIQVETATAPRHPIEHKLSQHEEMEKFQASMNNAMSSMRRKRDRTGSEDTASESSGSKRSLSHESLDHPGTEMDHVT